MSIETRRSKFGSGTRRLPGGREPSLLVEETKSMDRRRREAEQQGHRQFAAVKAREHSDNEVQNPSLEGDLQNDIPQHPELISQRFDGVDSPLNPDPPLNSAARRELDNAERKQQEELSLRLGHQPRFSSAPTPRAGG